MNSRRLVAHGTCEAWVGWFVFASLVASATQVSWSDPDFIVLNTYVPNNGDDWDMQDRRRVWDKEAMTFATAVDKPLVWIGE